MNEGRILRGRLFRDRDTFVALADPKPAATVNKQTARINLRQALGRLEAGKLILANATQSFRSRQPKSVSTVAYHLHAVSDDMKFSREAFKGKVVQPGEIGAIDFAVGFAFVDPKLSILVLVKGNAFAQLVNRSYCGKRQFASIAETNDEFAKSSTVPPQPAAKPILVISSDLNRVINRRRILKRCTLFD